MSLVKFERIVSVSSEDPSFPAENLLKSNYNDKKWKCKHPGEKQISVVIQMESAVTINAIDIGNYGSAFIEVFVGKSSNPDDFKVLIVASSLMTLHEAKLGENISNVRFFKEDSLIKPVALEKWDRIKLVCSQPYNKFIQYGLSFVVVHSKNIATSHSAVSPLGKFNLKTKDESEDITVGSLFAKRKAGPAPELKGAAAIRAASTSGIITQKKPSLMALYAPTEEDEKSIVSGTSSETNVSSENNSSSPVLRKDNKKKQKPDKLRTLKVKPDSRFNGSPAHIPTSAIANGESSSKKTPIKNKEETKKNIVPKKCPEKPFNQLLNGVVFAISGFQNPYRSDLRNKALAMGAKYRPDWDSTCTHLLCAFPNTPKFNQVLGHGKIVTKEWIETCYSRRMRLPWRRFALHPPDKNLPESEEEVIEYVPRPPSPVDNRRRVSPGPTSSGEDTEEEIERVLKLQNKIKKEESQVDNICLKDETDVRNGCIDRKPSKDSQKMFDEVDVPPVVKESNSEHQSPSNRNKIFNKNKKKESSNSSPGSKKKNVITKMLPTNKKRSCEGIQPMDQEACIIPDVDYDPGPSRKFCETDIYEMDTDVEPENSFSKQYGLMPLLTYYEDIRFFIGKDFTDMERKKVARYIFAHKGIVVEKPNFAVEFIITRSADEVEKVKKLCPKAVGVKPDWVWLCHDCNYLAPISKFEIK